VHRLAALSLILLATSACTALLSPGEAQCEKDADCKARGFANAACEAQVCVSTSECDVPADCKGFTDPICTDHKCSEKPVDPVWGCLGHVTEPTPDQTKKVALSIKLELVDLTPVTTVTVDICDKLDPGCVGANPDLPKGLTPGADGMMHLSLPQGFDGFVRITDNSLPTDDQQRIVDSRVYVGRPIVTPPDTKAVQLLRRIDFNQLVPLSGTTADPTRGTAILLAVDCQGKSASGVRFETAGADAKSVQFYLINQAPTTPPTATSTDADGFGGFFNLPVSAGTSVVKSYRAADDVYIGESSFQIYADTISYVQIAPTP
jgi:hypothetical protein